MQHQTPPSPSSVSLQFGLMTDLSSVVRPDQSNPQYGIIFGIERPIAHVGAGPAAQLGSLAEGSSDTPIAVHAFTIGKRSFFALLNPLDSCLRPTMQRQHDEANLPFVIMAPTGAMLKGSSKVRVFHNALQDTVGRNPCDVDAWFKHAQQKAPAIVADFVRADATFAACEQHGVYIIVPNTPGHRLSGDLR